MKLIENIKYSEYEQNLLDIYLPDAREFPVFVYFHGGGMESGDKRCRFINDLVLKGVCVVSANYRMYPDASFPDFLYDGAAAVSWTKENIKNYGKPTGLFVGGSSAGGYISLMLCFDSKYLSKYNTSNKDITAYYHDAGQPTVHYNVMRERGQDTRKVVIDEASPIYHIDAERYYPPMEIVVSDNDMPNRYEQTLLLVSTLKHFGYDAPLVTLDVQKDSTHCSYTHQEDENGRYIFADMVYDFIKRKLQN